MSGYTQTLLLDCNRLSSVEYSASKLSDSDKSLFTNKVADGLELNVGDQVSVNSAYISERGAGSSVIEFKGKELGDNTKITYVSASNVCFVGFDEGGLPYNYPLPEGYGRQTFTEVEEEIPLRDNEVSIVVQYYKNTNGDMNITLPRRFGSASSTKKVPTNASGYWTFPDNQDTGLNTFSQNSSHIYAPDWNINASMDSLMFVGHLHNAHVAHPQFDTTTGLPTAANNGSAVIRKIKQDNSRFTIFVKDKIIWNGSFLDTTGFANASAAATDYLEAIIKEPFADRSGESKVHFRDPALMDYIPFSQKVKLSVDAGYDTPSNVANTITDQLIQTDDPIPQSWDHRTPQPNYPAPANPSVYSNIINSTLYRSFPAANYTTYGKDKWDAYQEGSQFNPIGGVSPAENTSDDSFDYLNNYAYVGFKRPEFVVKGRKAFEQLSSSSTSFTSAAAGAMIIKDMPIAGSGTAVIETSVSWTDDNLTKIRDFFDVQRKLYPELISGNRISNSNYTDSFLQTKFQTTSGSLNASFEDQARFLHINPYRWWDVFNDFSFNASRFSYITEINYKTAEFVIGNDMTHMPANPLTFSGSGMTQGFSTQDPAIYNAYAKDLSSLPIYVYYNSSSANVNGSESEGNSYSNLVYGFARKTASGTIAFTTENIGGIPKMFYSDGTKTAFAGGSGTSPTAGYPHIQGTKIGGTSADGNGRRIGYDFHFNGYGNAAIMLNTGYNYAGFYGHQQYVNSSGCRRAMLGANNPLLDFSSVDNRFEWKNLHTAEKTGNFYNAGDPDPASNEIAPPPSGQADVDCYKINKVSNYVTWSPSMMPYPDIDVIKKQNISHTFPSPNPNLERQVVIDSQCGITITDMGITEDLWDESLWGILGFSYRQFYPNASVLGNINTRMNNVNTNVSGATTNAYITSIDSEEYRVNPFGANLYSTQAPLATDYGDTAGWMFTGTANYFNLNSITVNANSTAISASQLPRKQLRGYYLLSSNILSDANYYREANPMQVLAVVDKYNAEGDFVNYSGGGPVFTVTKPTVLSDVKTAILDPDGSEAQVDSYSGVIYRIDKKINTDLNFAETIMAEQQKK